MKKIFILAFLTSLIGCSQVAEQTVESKDFTSKNNSFSIKIPSAWAGYEAKEDTYDFYDANNEKENLRITFVELTADINSDTSNYYLNSEYEKNKEIKAVKKIINGFNCVAFSKTEQTDTKPVKMYYWLLGKKNRLLFCSFSTTEIKQNEAENKNDFDRIEKIINSIKTK